MAATPKIDFNIPIPARTGRNGSTATETMRKLCASPVGASAFFETERPQSVRNIVLNVGGPGWAACRTVVENDKRGVRVWKIAESTILRGGNR